MRGGSSACVSCWAHGTPSPRPKTSRAQRWRTLSLQDHTARFCLDKVQIWQYAYDMRIEEARKIYAEMKSCTACPMRATCTQVVTYDGILDDTPLLLICGEAPGKDEDEKGIPFVGDSGRILREALRATKILKKNNTIISNVLKCRPVANKFPTNKDIPQLCVSKWLDKEIAAIEPKRMLLLGNVPLFHLAGMKGIRTIRGTWLTVKGIRTLPTYHPSYVIRQMNEGDMEARADFFQDVMTVAEEVAQLQEALP